MRVSPHDDLNSWPSSNVFTRKPPGVAVIGRTWMNVHIDRIPYLVGEIFGDLDRQYMVIGLMFEFTRNEVDRITCTITLVELTKKLIEIRATRWQHLSQLMTVFLTFNEEDGGGFPTLCIECDRSGLYWEAS